MSSSDFTYVIPPYLLNTCVGQELHQELRWLDPELAAKNFFSPETSGYRFRLPRDLKQDPHSFCDNVHINNLIRDKLKEKFAVLGILGTHPPDEVSDEYLHGLYEMFKDRLMQSKPEAGDASKEITSLGQQALNAARVPSSASLPIVASSFSADSASRTRGSVFDIPRYGEFTYRAGHSDTSSFCLETCPLDMLISWARDKKEHKYSFFPYLMANNKNFFLSSLPMYWTPLSSGENLANLDKRYGMVSDIENGYSVLRLKLSPDVADFGGRMIDRKRFYNFIANNEIKETTGVFYYEVSVEQTATRGTSHEPLILTNDPSVSSGSSLFFNMGFTKRNIKFDRLPSATATLSAATLTIDLKEVQGELCLHDLDYCGTKLDEDTVTFLGAEPGVSFEGSLAISFNNSCSYASIKKTEGSYRTSSLNMNRRFSQLNRHSSGERETSKLDIDAPFHTHSLSESGDKKDLFTDTVGFGVNFIERSLFVTLNGVMVKTIYEQDITSSNRYQDSIFGQGPELGPLYPMIGFRLSDLGNTSDAGGTSESRIITNFGLKSFQFNINSYIRKFKLSQKKELSSVVSDEIRNLATTIPSDVSIGKLEKAIRDVQDDPAILNEFIEGYLIQEGFLGSLDAFKSDLEELSKNISQHEDEDMEEDTTLPQLAKTVMQSKALQRQMIKRNILERHFVNAIDLLRLEFPNLDKLETFIFELQLLQYIEMLRRFYDVKFRPTAERSDAQQNLESSLFKETFSYGQLLISKCGKASADALGELSSTLLLNSKEDLRELPQASRLFERHANDIKVLACMINSEILETQNFTRESRLENMVVCTGENISKLSSENKNPFRLVNFENDYVDV